MEMNTVPEERRTSREGNGSMTVAEAGHRGGQRVKELIEEGKEAEGRSSERRRMP
jgi:hypothetical protein